MQTNPTSATVNSTVSSTAQELPLVCVCVITYDGKRFLKRCFQTLQQLTDYPNHRVTLIDNGSSDGSADYVRENFSDVEILRISPNTGYAHAANEAIKHAQLQGGEYVAILNDDIVILHSNWLREAIAHAERDPAIGVIGFVEATSDKAQHTSPESKLTEVDYLNGFVMVFPLRVIERIGTFDEGYFAYNEEDDLGARAQAAGFRLVWLNIPIYHLGSGTNQNYKLQSAYLQMRNGIRFCLKNRGHVHALLRALRILDVACNPWPIAFDKSDTAHRRMRNSGNIFVNLLVWLRAVSWNIVRIPQTFSIRSAERRFINANVRGGKGPNRNSTVSRQSGTGRTAHLGTADIGGRT
jgi:GT2 family glycosyltransferase